LEKLEDTITNENRSNVSRIGDNKLYAKYRANKLVVKQIINKYDLTKCEKVMSNFCGFKIEYKINETVYPNKFDTDLEKVCSFGIHYFLKLERAFYYVILMDNVNGKYLEWHDNGQIMTKGNCIGNKLNGECFKWYDNGQISITCNYNNGHKHGEYLKCHYNGQTLVKCNYINGKLNDEYLEWCDNGQINVKCNYINGKKNGEYLEYYHNGQTFVKCNYIDGELNGEYLSWCDNGQINITCKYVNGELTW
jgi:antitoxin component YwqK of YwqJK toxin-antitoxin module